MTHCTASCIVYEASCIFEGIQNQAEIMIYQKTCKENRKRVNKELNLARLILNLSNTIINNRNKHLEALELTTSQADAMKFFLENQNSSIKSLKEAMSITHQTAQGIVARLIEKGLLTAQQSQKDKRFQIIHVTEAGLSLSKKINANGKRTAAMLVNGMSEDDQRNFMCLLRIAYKNVKNDGKADD